MYSVVVPESMNLSILEVMIPSGYLPFLLSVASRYKVVVASPFGSLTISSFLMVGGNDDEKWKKKRRKWKFYETCWYDRINVMHAKYTINKIYCNCE